MAAASSSTSFLPPTSLHRKLKLNHHHNTHLIHLQLPPPFLSPPNHHHLHLHSCRFPLQIVAFQRSDFESLKSRVLSGDAFKEAWRSANDGFEQLIFDAKKAAERFDRRYDVSRRVSSAAEAASLRVRELDREYEFTQKWRAFSLDFSRNLPRYRKQFSNFLDTPIGRSSATIFFLWFALSGWLFRCLILATWVLPIAGPLLLTAVANNMTVKGACPACKREFIGVKNSMIRCQGCGNIVWQPQGPQGPQGDFFSKGDKGSTRSKSKPDIIDVEFEEK